MTAKVFIIGMDIAVSRVQDLASLNFQCYIVDEAHLFKGQGDRREQLIPVFQKSKRVILLSIPPATKQPSELYNLLRILRPDICPTLSEFTNRYQKSEEGKSISNNRGFDEELNYILKQTIMIRRLRKDIFTGLPDKNRVLVEIQLDQKSRKECTDRYKEFKYGEVLKHYREDHANEQEQHISFGLSLLEAFQQVGQAKIVHAAYLVMELVKKGKKVVVFSSHATVLN